MTTQNNGTSIEPAIRTFLADNYLYKGGAESISDTDSFLGQGLIDSMGILELVAFLEQTYAIRVADDEVVPENLDSIRRVSDYVRRKLAANTVGAAHAG
jgi:acyl carrier protein